MGNAELGHTHTLGDTKQESDPKALDPGGGAGPLSWGQ